MQVERHPSLYHADGDIILAASASPELRQLFRVHKLFLAHHSDVFKDMLQLGQGAQVDAIYDGVPVVAMSDKAEDLAALLDIIYNPTYVWWRPTHKRHLNSHYDT